jgi:hypothetical protein
MNFDTDDAVHDEKLSKKLGIPVVEAKSFHRLNQIVGYAKYVNGQDGNIYFRGQSNIYASCLPSLLRSGRSDEVSKRKGASHRKIEKLSVFLKSAKSQVPLISKVDDIFIEPLLQHYGINTRWLDLVDNVWVAIWFGLHEYKSVQSKKVVNQKNPFTRDYVHVIKRKDGYMYLLLVHSDATQSKAPGYFVGKETKLVDLRIGCPPAFLRPHAQHGLLAFIRSTNVADHNFYKRTVGIVKIAVPDAWEWMGGGNLLTHANMYPSPVYDFGYRFLLDVLEVKNEDRKTFGTINVYAAS